MGCCNGDREKLVAVRDEQKWEYINLDDFKSNSCWTPLAYGYLYVSLFISVSIYCVDTFTAINLLAFDRWSGQIKPEIPLRISRWIFAGCIILSFVFLFYRWLRAIRVMKQSGVAQSYLDPLAVRIQSIRMGKEGRGWKRFLVFAELTKSKKGADYVALFTYFSFEAWLRVCFAEGPRQVINGVTLYSVMRLKLLPQGDQAASNGHSPIIQFFVNIGVLADSNVLQAVVLFGMLWTLLIWVISALSLFFSVVLYLVFLFHHVPTRDGSLSKYCRRKINGRMERIVKVKVDKALKKENQLRERQLAKEGGDIKRQPTLPDLGDASEPIPGLSRQTTMTTLPEYTSRPQTGRSDNSLNSTSTFPDTSSGNRPPPPNRTVTNSSDASWASYRSNAPLMNGAGDMGYAGPERGQTPTSMSSGPWNSKSQPGRNITGMSQYSQRSFSPGPGSRPGTAQGGRNTPGTYQMEPLPRSGTTTSNGSSRSIGRHTSESESIPPLPQGRTAPANQYNPYFPQLSTGASSGPSWSQSSVRSPEEAQGRRTPASATNPFFPSLPESNGRNSPAPSMRSQTPNTFQSQRSYTPMGQPTGPSITAGRPPPLPRLQTSSNFDNSQYVAYSPSTQTPMPHPSAPPNGANRAFSRPMMTPIESSYGGRRTPPYPESVHYSSRRDNESPSNKHDSVGDILDSY